MLLQRIQVKMKKIMIVFGTRPEAINVNWEILTRENY